MPGTEQGARLVAPPRQSPSLSDLQIFVLAVVQGVTEFLPISSQAHLILVDDIFGWSDAGLGMRVAMHVGSLGAVLVYFRSDIRAALSGLVHMFRRPGSADARLARHLLIASAPVVVAGAAFVVLDLEDRLDDPAWIAWSMVVFGVLLWVADRIGKTVRRVEHMGASAAVAIGLAQVLALVPGTSRAGVTMTAARLLGYERTEASRFAVLLGIPVILAAGGSQAYEIGVGGDWQLGRDAILAAAVGFAAAYASVSLMMRWLRRASFTPFVIYRLAVGAVLLLMLYT